jgi:hypothetical protein
MGMFAVSPVYTVCAETAMKLEYHPISEAKRRKGKELRLAVLEEEFWQVCAPEENRVVAEV